MSQSTRHSRLGAALLRVAGGAIGRLSSQRSLTVVNYHRVLAQPDPLLDTEPDVATFHWQMALLAECFNVMPLYEALRALDEGRLPPRTVCITFDDGYRSVHDLALPILRKFKLPATVFVTSGFVGGQAGNMWNDRIIHAVQSLPEGTLDLRDIGLECYPLTSIDARKQTALRLTEAGKYLPPLERQNLVERLDRLSGMPHDALMLTPEMLMTLERNGMEIGAHTISHPILTSLDDDSARVEIAAGKAQLEALIGKPVRLFAYPNGKVGQDFDARHVEMVRQAGFFAAFTTAVGRITSGQDRFQLPRSRPWDRTPFRFGLRLLSWMALGKQQPATTLSNKDSNMHDRALLIAFHFPPQAASSGIQRSLSFSRHLPASGWEPAVLTARASVYEAQNPSQLASIPPNLLVRRAFALDAKRHMGWRGRYLNASALPDRWISWCMGAVPAGLSLIRAQRPRLIWSTFPIATAHLIGLALHRLTGLPWVADFRDPMLQPAYPTHKAQRRMYAWIEQQTIRRCSKAVFTTQGAMASYRERFPDLDPNKFVVIENGYDEDAFGAPESATPAAGGRPVTLVHSGLLYDTGRDPSAFLDALARLKARGVIGADTLRIVLRAPGNIAGVSALIDKYGVADLAATAEPVPYRAALAEMAAADGLLLFQGTPFNNQIPAKVYEYFRARKPIFGLVDHKGETARVLGAAGFDDTAYIDDAAEIAARLERFLARLRDNTAHVASLELVERSSRAHRARQLAGVFDEVVYGAVERKEAHAA
jgi:peptidoglycan/xylan/chitin deacetylase (PgdA/CDA1 family)